MNQLQPYDELTELQSEFAQAIRVSRETDPRLGEQIERINMHIMHATRGSLDALMGIYRLTNNPAILTQIRFCFNQARSEFADRTLLMWDRYKDIWLLESCWSKVME